MSEIYTGTIHDTKIPDKHCMVDLETLGSNPKSPIVQVGMVFFTVEGILTQSLLTVDFDDALRHGEPDGSTYRWWLQQPKEAQESLFKNPRPIMEVADIIEKLLVAQNASFYWAHATFDFPILQSLFRSLGRKYPLPYKRCYDLRTLEYLSNHPQWEPRTGIHHNALDDATYQASHAIKCLQILKKG
jgi:DNA polymerase III epsilon subunit-like protein